MRTSVLALLLALSVPTAALAQDSVRADAVAGSDPGVQTGAELGAIDHRIESLRADLGRTEARLRLLMGDEAVGAARLAISHDNRMSSAYRLVRVQYALDGQVVFTQTDTDGALAGRAHFDVYSGAAGTGPHVLTVGLEYLGEGYGVFDYAHGFHYRLHGSTTLEVPSSGAISVHVVGFEQNAPLAPLSQRPSLRFELQVAGRDAH